MIIQTATVSVDTFLFISGFLIAWLGLKEMEKTKGKLNILSMYIHRYIRLTPAVAAAVLLVVSLLKFMGSGPYWHNFLDVHKKGCDEYWWSTLLYVQNYVNPNNLVSLSRFFCVCLNNVNNNLFPFSALDTVGT